MSFARGNLVIMPLPGPGRGIWRWMAVRGYALRAAELAGAAAGPVTSVALLIAGCALVGVAAAGGGGAVVAIVLAAVLVAVVFACCDRMALSAMLARLARPGSAGSGPGLGALEHALMLLFGPVAAVIVRLAVSQEREYQADAAGALLSGDPVALAGALRKIDAGTAKLALAPDGRRISVGHLMIADPFRPEGLARLFRTHPPAGERVRRLEALAGYR